MYKIVPKRAMLAQVYVTGSPTKNEKPTKTLFDETHYNEGHDKK